MNVEVNTGRWGTWRSPATDHVARGETGTEVQVVPQEMYDSARAKIAANLHWLFAKAFGADDIPPDLQDPFYTDQYNQEHIKPPIIHLLLSAELYCRVCELILEPEHSSPLHSHQSVIQALSRKGIYVLEDNNSLVAELDLISVPIKMSSHMHLIDALMLAYTVEMISVEKVDSEDLPCHLEDAMVYWINKVNINIREVAQKELKMKHLLESPGHQKVRCRKEHFSGRSHQNLSLLDNLSNFILNGTAVLAVIHFYCPELLKFEDICLKEVPSIADSLYNIQLLREFSDKFLNKCFYLGPEDVLYSPPVLKSNMIQFIAELFWIFEIVRPDFVQPRDIPEIKDVRLLLQSSQSCDSILHATSFMTSNTGNYMAKATRPEISSKTGSYSCVLPSRQKERKVIEDHVLDMRTTQSTTFGFPGKKQRQRPLSQTVPYALHFPINEDADSISLARSSSEACSFMSPAPKHMQGPGHPRRLSGHSLRDHIRYEDEEEEIEEEELVAIIDPTTLPRHQYKNEIEQKDLTYPSTASIVKNTHVSPCCDASPLSTKHPMDRYYLEPLMPTIPKPAKEKSVSVNKEEECGESDSRDRFSARKITSGSGALHRSTSLSDSKHTHPSISGSKSASTLRRTPVQGFTGFSQQEGRTLAHGFFLHLSDSPKDDSPLSSIEAGNESDSDIENLIEDKENQLELTGDFIRSQGSCCRRGQGKFGEGESAKLGEDINVCEWQDKEDHSGRSSPCLSTMSWSSSCSTAVGTGVKMTSFAEKKKLKLRDGLFSTSSTPITTPDGSDTAPCPPWQLKNSGSSNSLKEPCYDSRKNVIMNSPVVPSELLELHMQLEERRHAIEFQKKKMETLSAQQRLKLGKAAFLNVVRKETGKSDTLPLPLKQENSEVKSADSSKVKAKTSKDDSCLEALKMKARQTEGALMIRDNKVSQDSQSDLNECSRSIEVLNEAIASIQQQMTQLSLQQDMLIKHSAMSPSESNKLQSDRSIPSTVSTEESSKAFVVNFVNTDSNSFSLPCRPSLSSSQRKTSERKRNIQNNTNIPENKVKNSGDGKRGVAENTKTEQNSQRNKTSCDDMNQHCAREEKAPLPVTLQPPGTSNNTAFRPDENTDSETEAAGGDDCAMIKTQLVEVGLSEVRGSLEHRDVDEESEQKNALGFYFKDDERADEMEKRRAAFLLKQQRKAEEAKVRKQQQEAESELKREEARRKAEEERIRKEEEKARRELIKQEYLRRKQQMLMEEQGLVKPWSRTRSRKSRPKSLHREGSNSLSKGTTTPDLSSSRRGSTLSLATECESVISEEAHRAESVCSMESFPVLSRSSSRNMERDWENGSIASSITSTEYTGPKLFKEPSSKSNKPIIINAIAHCCLAGKVNESQKNVILEELDKCESNHLIILFRDGGCQFRAIYAYSPDTEEILKVTGTGPRNISPKMIDKLYKYSSDRKQFIVIPAKSVSASVDALTIHNHLWHVRRPGSARRK